MASIIQFMGLINQKFLATGHILELWQSEDHPEALPGDPVWTDDQNTNWGRVAKWPVPYGFIRVDDPEFHLYSPIFEEYVKLKWFFTAHYALIPQPNLGQKTLIILPPKEIIRFPGMPKYDIKRLTTLEGKDRLVVYFEERIILPDGDRSDRFVISTRPALKMDLSGEEPDWIPFF